jgi:hypothetical protein
VSDGDEVFNGTDPRDATDSATTPDALLRRVGSIARLQTTSTEFRMTRRNGPNLRPLRVECSTTLREWVPVMDLIPTGPSTTVILPVDGPIKFYRFVENPPLP